MTINLRIDHDSLSVSGSSCIVSGSKNYYNVSGVFTPDWDELERFLVLSADGKSFFSVQMTLSEEDSRYGAVLPESLIGESGTLLMGIIGKEQENIRICTNLEKIKIIQGASEADSCPPAPAEDGGWSKYLHGEINKLSLRTDGIVYLLDADNVDDEDFDLEYPQGAYLCLMNGENPISSVLVESKGYVSVNTDSEFSRLIISSDIPEASASKKGLMTPEHLAELGRIKTAVGGCTWYIDTDRVVNSEGTECGTLYDCMTNDYAGSWFYARTEDSDAGNAKYPEAYIIDGANGYLSLRDYVIWTGDRLVHIPTFEAKASDSKNSDGKYSPKSGVDGLMSSTDKAYLTDLIDSYWGKERLPVYPTPDPQEGWQTNWLFNTGWYLGGIKKDCGGHPPVLNDNHTSWAILVLNGMATDAESLNHNHRVQIAFDVVNSRIYMRRGWMSSNEWAANWDDVGAVKDASITLGKLSSDVMTVLGDVAEISHTHKNKELLDSITSIEDICGKESSVGKFVVLNEGGEYAYEKGAIYYTDHIDTATPKIILPEMAENEYVEVKAMWGGNWNNGITLADAQSKEIGYVSVPNGKVSIYYVICHGESEYEIVGGEATTAEASASAETEENA